ncbi:hypothetical protein [Nocardia barduliensis]|uniref:hypothetical protein n=1 Tax=Nocardia barduliensis TaxID=2736643 RepID=UPI00157376E9|nr:hypothetical protein [Nocardia barduliensis]
MRERVVSQFTAELNAGTLGAANRIDRRRDIVRGGQGGRAHSEGIERTHPRASAAAEQRAQLPRAASGSTDGHKYENPRKPRP